MRSRFILFVLIIALIPAGLAFTTTTGAADRAAMDQEARASSALSALTDKLDAEAAQRRENLLRIIALPEVSSLVRDSAGSGSPPPPEAAVRVRAAVIDLFRDQIPELIAVVNQSGAQVVVTSGEAKRADVDALAPAGAALAGQTAVTYSKYGDRFYRLTAMPVGVADAALVLGDVIGESTVARLKEIVGGADVTFTVGGKPIVSSAKSFELPEKLGPLPPSAGLIPFGELRLSLPIPGIDLLRSVFPIMIPHAAYGSLSRSLSPVSRDAPQAHAPSSGAIAWVTVRSSLDWTGRAQVVGIIASLLILLMGIFWTQVIYGPVYRQARSIEAHLARLRVEQSVRLTTKGFSVPFTAIATLLDKLMDEQAKGQPFVPPVVRDVSQPQEISRPVIQRPPAELPLATSSPASSEVAASAFGFTDDPRTTGRSKVITGVGGSKEAPKPPPPPPPVMAPTPPPVAPKVDIRATATAITSPMIEHERDLSGPVPLPGSAGRNGAVKPAATSISDADIPPDLLARSQELERELLGGGGEESETEPELDATSDEEHYKAIFEEFLAVRKRCGESNDGLTLDKFTARLRKNRDQLMEKYKCRTVRFQVYVKEGKAAVKAVPVR